MERTEWLKKMRLQAASLYDRFAPLYWVRWGLKRGETHLAFLQKFLERVPPGGPVLSAGCGAGLWDGLLVEAGHPVTGIDQSAGMLERAREHFPQVHYEKMGFQEMEFHAAFDGVICIDALEHVCPEDYARALLGFARALRPGGWLYFTVDDTPSEDLEAVYQAARSRGLPVVPGELVERVDEAYEQVMAADGSVPVELTDAAVYHFYPSIDQLRSWLDQAGLTIEADGSGDGYAHYLVRKQE